MIKAVIFDCFGVLYPDPTRQFYKEHKHLFGGNSTYLDKINLQKDLGKITRKEFYEKIANKTGIPAEKIISWRNNILVPNSKLINYIRKLKIKYKIGLLSNVGKGGLTVIYKDKIDEFFDVVTLSSEESVAKPNEKIFSICVSRLGVKANECVLIDDIKLNTSAAQKYNLNAILYDNFDNMLSELNKLGVQIK